MFVCYETKVILKSLSIGILFILVIYFIWNNNTVNSSSTSTVCGGNKENTITSDVQLVKKNKKNEFGCINQEEKENNLYNKLLVDGGDKDAEKMLSDEYIVLAKDSESTKSQIVRSVYAYENVLPEGMYSPINEIEIGMMQRQPRKSI